MNILRNFYELVRETSGPFFPTSRSKKETFLGKVREKVSYYQPRIEEVCEVELGDIQVQDMRYWLANSTRNRIEREFEEYANREGREPSKLAKGFIASPILTARFLATPLIWTFMNLWGFEMKHGNSTIYVPFSYMNRFMDLDFKKREEGLDQAVVHEMSHTLWYSLGGDGSDNSRRNWRLWNEGFATYCADVHFAGIYPESFKVDQTKGSGIYQRGKAKVEELVQRYGKDIVLEVPKRWQEF